MTGSPLLEMLEDMTYSSYNDINCDTLSSLVRIADIKPKPSGKSNTIKSLNNFYSNPSSAATLFARLNEYEKELLTCIVHSGYRPVYDDLAQIAKSHKTKIEKNARYYLNSLKAIFFPKNSPLFAFFLENIVPDAFKEYLNEVIPPYRRVFRAHSVNNADEYYQIVGREDRYGDFDMLISYVNSNKTPATKAGGLISKSALLKFHKLAGYNDVCTSDSGDIEDVRTAAETTVSVGLAQLLRCAGVIEADKGHFKLSENAILYMSMATPEKAKFLLDKYIHNGNEIIDEFERALRGKSQFLKEIHDYSDQRLRVIEILKECPPNKWISFKQLTEEIYKANGAEFSKFDNSLMRNDYYAQIYYQSSRSEFQKNEINIMLMEYLATLGAVDVLVEEQSSGGFAIYSELAIDYFRVTDLGAYLFGVTDSYIGKDAPETQQSPKGFIVQPNFDVVIPDGPERMRHELFFDRFAEKTASDKQVCVYKLDFKGMVKALNIGLYIREINAYCASFSNAPVPDNVNAAFADWEAQSGRVRIRTVSVVESDDPYVLEEIKNYRGMGALSEGQLSLALVLAPNAEKKAKSLIERNKRFCTLSKVKNDK